MGWMRCALHAARAQFGAASFRPPRLAADAAIAASGGKVIELRGGPVTVGVKRLAAATRSISPTSSRPTPTSRRGFCSRSIFRTGNLGPNQRANVIEVRAWTFFRRGLVSADARLPPPPPRKSPARTAGALGRPAIPAHRRHQRATVRPRKSTRNSAPI